MRACVRASMCACVRVYVCACVWICVLNKKLWDNG